MLTSLSNHLTVQGHKKKRYKNCFTWDITYGKRPSAKFPFGKKGIRQRVPCRGLLTAKCFHGEMSLLWSFLAAKGPSARNPVTGPRLCFSFTTKLSCVFFKGCSLVSSINTLSFYRIHTVRNVLNIEMLHTMFFSSEKNKLL